MCRRIYNRDSREMRSSHNAHRSANHSATFATPPSRHWDGKLQCRDKGASQGMLASLEGRRGLECIHASENDQVDQACSQSRYDVDLSRVPNLIINNGPCVPRAQTVSVMLAPMSLRRHSVSYVV